MTTGVVNFKIGSKSDLSAREHQLITAILKQQFDMLVMTNMLSSLVQGSKGDVSSDRLGDIAGFTQRWGNERFPDLGIIVQWEPGVLEHIKEIESDAAS